MNSIDRLNTGVVNVATGFDLSRMVVADVAGPVVVRSGPTSVTIDLIPNGTNPSIDLSAAAQDLSFVANGTGILGLNLGAFNHVWTIASGRTLSVLTVTGNTANALIINGGGTTILGDGRVALILNPSCLVRESADARRA